MAANNFNFAFVVLFFLGGALFASAAIITNLIVAGSHKQPTKVRHYESGEVIKPCAWVQYNARYYLFALMFILFDVFAAFMIPWAVAYRQLVALGEVMLAFSHVIIFMAIVFGALVYAWRKGATKWV